MDGGHIAKLIIFMHAHFLSSFFLARGDMHVMHTHKVSNMKVDSWVHLVYVNK